MRRKSSSARSRVDRRRRRAPSWSRDPRPSPLRFNGLDGNCAAPGPNQMSGRSRPQPRADRGAKTDPGLAWKTQTCRPHARDSPVRGRAERGIDGVPIVSSQRDLLGHIEPDRGEVRKRRRKDLLGGFRIDEDVELRRRRRVPGHGIRPAHDDDRLQQFGQLAVRRSARSPGWSAVRAPPASVRPDAGERGG